MANISQHSILQTWGALSRLCLLNSLRNLANLNHDWLKTFLFSKKREFKTILITSWSLKKFHLGSLLRRKNIFFGTIFHFLFLFLAFVTFTIHSQEKTERFFVFLRVFFPYVFKGRKIRNEGKFHFFVCQKLSLC